MTKSITTTTSESDSVEITQNAKRKHQWTVKCYGEDVGDALTSALSIDTKLQEKFKGEKDE